MTVASIPTRRASPLAITHTRMRIALIRMTAVLSAFFLVRYAPVPNLRIVRRAPACNSHRRSVASPHKQENHTLLDKKFLPRQLAFSKNHRHHPDDQGDSQQTQQNHFNSFSNTRIHLVIVQAGERESNPTAIRACFLSRNYSTTSVADTDSEQSPCSMLGATTLSPLTQNCHVAQQRQVASWPPQTCPTERLQSCTSSCSTVVKHAICLCHRKT